jgi:hypothetical protein
VSLENNRLEFKYVTKSKCSIDIVGVFMGVYLKIEINKTIKIKAFRSDCGRARIVDSNRVK